jgi:hypothetical protein
MRNRPPGEMPMSHFVTADRAFGARDFTRSAIKSVDAFLD